MLRWGVGLGSIFLAFVLIKTCIRKRNRRQNRQLRECTRNMHNIQHAPISNQQHLYQVYPQNESQKIESQIKIY